jgi:hypothetical protein
VVSAVNEGATEPISGILVLCEKTVASKKATDTKVNTNFFMILIFDFQFFYLFYLPDFRIDLNNPQESGVISVEIVNVRRTTQGSIPLLREYKNQF